MSIVSNKVFFICTARESNPLVDPSNLSDGLHYFEVYGIDCKAPWRGHIERRYIEVPHGASWAEVTMKTSGFDTVRRFYVAVPTAKTFEMGDFCKFSFSAAKSFSFRVVSSQTLELVISQFWPSGTGSHETASVDFEVVLHGIKVNEEEVILDGSDAPVRIDAETLLVFEELAPVALLNKIRVPYRPINSKIIALSTDRDKLPSGKQILALTLNYKIKLEDGAQIKPHIPLLNDRIYETKFESQFYMISDSNKHVYSIGDAYPSSSNLPKGEYILQLYLRYMFLSEHKPWMRVCILLSISVITKLAYHKCAYLFEDRKIFIHKSAFNTVPRYQVLEYAVSQL
ncbi:Tripeptidyl-peptidase 2 [Glycine soja]|uniref:Tripeptidyl-peptidase 2 n=1 Tax=Glycine soja TaxID=3848 RepID=A0A445J0R8_GLYSO|nr:Tripeptidyl-peptidase 2 [Glycine soja]